ncbi:cytochrome P450 [Auricularia subglabra TFB-10046 SS5]|nr:cytochrome P450 [Auricularia subglabra TFB-10046 SS5]
MALNSEYAGLAVAAAAAGFLVWFIIMRPRLPFPPGPKGLPLIGSLLEWPTLQEWRTFAQWRRRYGDIVYANVLGTHLVVLNSPDIARALLDDRGAAYSDRPYKRFLHDIVGWRDSPILGNADHPYFKPSHRLMHSAVGSRAALDGFVPLLGHEVHRFLLRVIDAPDNARYLLRKFAGTVILRIVYGYDVKPDEDEYVNLIEQVNNDTIRVIATGNVLVDLIPALEYVPRWFPGTGWMAEGERMRDRRIKALLDPLTSVKERLAAGTAHNSFVASELMRPDWNEQQDKNLLAWSAQSLYAAGTDTTVAAFYAFFLCMTLFPEAQAQAQAEIDSVIGPDTLPTWSDCERLPYVRALAKEVQRWAPVTPQSVPHCSNADGMFGGYFIPKGAVIIPNVWGFTRDVDIYPNPEQFDPSRFLGDRPQADPRDFAFGFGRRVCAGRQLAEASLFFLIANSLATLQISKKVGDDGLPIAPKVEFASGSVAHPAPFECDIRPRGPRAEALIRTAHDVPFGG